MSASATLKKLRDLGTAQNRKIYARHGVTGKMFGVSYSNLGKLVRSIKTDHDLCESLWKSANHDARVLATMVGDASKLTATKLERWVKDCDNYVITDAFARLAGKSKDAKKVSMKWIKSKDEWISTAGWATIVHTMESFTQKELEGLIGRIEKSIHKCENRTRHSMNQALICIGTTSASLHKTATAAAKRIGKVEVDHGETGCKTPDAIAYMKKVLDYNKKKAAKKKAAPKKKTAKKKTVRKAGATAGKKKAAAKKKKVPATKKKAAKKATKKPAAKKKAAARKKTSAK